MVHTCKVMGSCIWDKWKLVVCHYFSKHKYVFQFSRDQNPDFSGKVRRVQTQFDSSSDPLHHQRIIFYIYLFIYFFRPAHHVHLCINIYLETETHSLFSWFWSSIWGSLGLGLAFLCLWVWVCNFGSQI